MGNFYMSIFICLGSFLLLHICETQDKQGKQLTECMTNAKTQKEENICIITYEQSTYRTVNRK